MKQLLLIALLLLTLTSAATAKDKKRVVKPEPTPKERHQIRKALRKLGSRRPKARKEAAEYIGSLGLKAEMAVPTLSKTLLETKSSEACETLVTVLEKLAKEGSQSALVALIKAAAKHKNVDARLAIILGLGNLREMALPAAVTLGKLITNKDKSVRREAIKALGNVGLGKAKNVEKNLNKALAEDDPSLSLEAAMTMAKLGFKADSIVPKLLKILQHDKTIDADRQRAAEALGMLGENAAPAVEALIKIVEHKISEGFNPALPYGSARKQQNDKIRKAAIETLGLIGPKAKASIAAIEKTLEETFLKSTAEKALSLIKG